MTEILRPDLCVIGGGPGGIAAARRAATMGAKVVLVEKRPPNGYDHLQAAWYTQSLIAAGLRHPSRSAARFGQPESEPPRIDFKRLRRESDAASRRFACEDAPARLAGLNIRLIQAAGSFSGPSRFEAGDVAIEARQFLLAIASSPTAPAIPGLELARPLTADRLFELTAIPRRLVVIGGNKDHLPLAQAFGRLGAKVAIVQETAFLRDEDPELAATLADALRQDGIEIVDSVTISKVELVGTGPGAGIKLVLGNAAFVDATHVLYAPERLPLVEGLGLKAARVAYDKTGLKLKAGGRSSNPKIYAMRDSFDDLRSIRLARLEGACIADGLFGRAAPTPPVARIIGTDPELAFVGLGENEARAQRRKVHVLRAGFCDNLRAMSGSPLGHGSAHGMGPGTGHVKIIADSTGHLIGAGIVGPQARELIGIFGLALAKGLTVGDLESVAADEPTLMEVCRAAALAPLPQKGKVAMGKFPLRRFSH
jgi:pyruvate/2-oxoglutarate dehydrogenase complex dihydrolipoamide dehydrogenase (E3) component